MPEAIEIKGGADPYMTAAILAALQALWEEEAAGSDTSGDMAQDAWVMTSRSRPTQPSGARAEYRGQTLSSRDNRDRREET